MALTEKEILRWSDATGDATGTPTADPVSGLPYWSWSLTNTRRFSVRIPTGFTAGTAITLKLLESTAGVSLRHKWQAVCTLKRPEIDSSATAASETFTSEVVSSSVANRLMPRTITITTAGQINSITPAKDYLLTVVLTRIAASGSEDGNAIKLHEISVGWDIDVSAVSSVPGRLGAIITRVFTLGNIENEVDKTDAPLTAAKCIVWANQCKEDVAAEDYWEKMTTMTTAASTAAYDLETAIPRYRYVDHVWWNSGGTKYELTPFSSRLEYDQKQATNSAEGEPLYFIIEDGDLILWPTPDAIYTDAVEIHHGYSPADFDDTTNYTPSWPVSYDDVVTFYCLWLYGLKDATGRHIPALVTQYETLYRRKKAELIDSQHRPRVPGRPPR